MRASEIVLTVGPEDSTAYAIYSNSRYDTWNGQRGFVIQTKGGSAFIMTQVDPGWVTREKQESATEAMALTYTFADFDARQTNYRLLRTRSSDDRRIELEEGQNQLKSVPIGWRIIDRPLSYVKKLWSIYEIEKIAQDLAAQIKTQKINEERNHIASERTRLRAALATYGYETKVGKYDTSISFHFTEIEAFIQAVKESN